MLLHKIQQWCDQLNQLNIILLLTVLGLCAYANAVNHPFVHDDVVFIQQNPHIGDLDPKNIFIQTSVHDEKFPLVNQYYRPFLEIVNRVLYRIIHLNPHGFHFFNILLHIANSFLVYRLIGFLTDNKKTLSLAVAILFLIHPVQNEAVACISGISNLVFAFLCLSSFCVYLVFRNAHGKRSSISLYVASLIIFFLALLTKEQSVVLPLLIIVYEIYFARSTTKTLHKKIWYIFGFFAVLAGYFILRTTLFGSPLTPVSASRYEIFLALFAIPRSVLIYGGLILFPHGLHYYRSQDILLPYIWPTILFIGIAIGITLIVVRMPKLQRRWMVFGIGWFFISMLPTLNIIPLINEYSLIFTAEHFLYFPIIGALFFIVSFVHCLVDKAKSEKVALTTFALFCIVSVIFVGMTVKQNTYWRGEIPLFERTVKYQKDFGRAHYQLAKAYALAGRFEEAIDEDRKALAIFLGYTEKVQNETVKAFYSNFIGNIYYHMGYCFDAIRDPTNSLIALKNALNTDSENEIFQYSVGLAYIKIKDMKSAARHFEKTLEVNESNLLAMNSLAICYQKLGENAKAERLLKTIVQEDSRSVSAKRNLERFLKKKDQAVHF